MYYLQLLARSLRSAGRAAAAEHAEEAAVSGVAITPLDGLREKLAPRQLRVLARRQLGIHARRRLAHRCRGRRAARRAADARRVGAGAGVGAGVGVGLC